MAYIYNLTDTWNAGGTTFAGIKMAVTNTASGASSKLLDLTVSGATTGSFSVDKSGNGAFSGLLTLAAGTAAAPALSSTGDSNTGVYFPSADTISLVTGGAARLNADSSGNINIGSGANAVGLRYLDIQNVDTGVNSGGILRFITYDAAGTALSTGNVIKYKNGTFAFSNDETGAAANMSFSVGGSPRILINLSGNVGIGSTSPAARLDVRGTNALFGDATADATAKTARLCVPHYTNAEAAAAFFICASQSTLTNVGIGGGSGSFNAATQIQFYTAANTTTLTGTERLRIDANGNVVVNTAAIATNATNGFLYVAGCAGTPTGVPTAYTGRVPIVVDTTNNKLYFYSGGAWRDAGP